MSLRLQAQRQAVSSSTAILARVLEHRLEQSFASHTVAATVL